MKRIDNYNIAFESIHASSREDWYFDNGCFWQMKGNSAFFPYLKECSLGYVKVLGKEDIIKLDLPQLQDVRLIKGLSASLISISQLCDQWFQVSFSKDKCEDLDKGKIIVISGTCFSDNDYHWNSCSKQSVCNLSKSNDFELYHKGLGHINLPSIHIALGPKPVLGIPHIKTKTYTFCREC